MSSSRTERLPRVNYVLPTEITKSIPWFRKRILAWFPENRRKLPWRAKGRSKYEVLIAEILLQRTTAAQVAQAYKSFLERFPSWVSLGEAAEEDLSAVLVPLGLSKQKTRAFKSLARAMLDHGGRLPSTRVELQQLPGVGQYIASVMLAVFAGRPEPMLDVNMSRVLERFWRPRDYADIRDDPFLQTLSRQIVRCKRSLEINWAILDLASLRCKARLPKCLDCPLLDRCQYHLLA